MNYTSTGNKSLITFCHQATRRPAANGSIPQGRHPQAEEDTFFGGVGDTVSPSEGRDNVRVFSTNGTGSGMSKPTCSKLDVIRMDCPGGLVDEDQDDLVKVVRGLLDKENQTNKDDQIRREWRMLAEAVDRWLFWSFLLITTVSTLLFLVILPFCHRGKFF